MLFYTWLVSWLHIFVARKHKQTHNMHNPHWGKTQFVLVECFALNFHLDWNIKSTKAVFFKYILSKINKSNQKRYLGSEDIPAGNQEIKHLMAEISNNYFSSVLGPLKFTDQDKLRFASYFSCSRLDQEEMTNLV